MAFREKQASDAAGGENPIVIDSAHELSKTK